MKRPFIKKKFRTAMLAGVSAMTLLSSAMPTFTPFRPVPVSAAETISVHNSGVDGAFEEMIQYKNADADHIAYQIDASRFNLKNADVDSFTSSGDTFRLGTSPLIWDMDQMQSFPSIPRGRAIYYAGEMPTAFLDKEDGTSVYHSRTIHPSGNCSIKWRDIVRGSDGRLYDLKMTVGIDDLTMFDWVWYYKVYNKDTYFYRIDDYADDIKRRNANATDDKLLSFPEWFPDYRDTYMPDYWHTEFWPRRTTLVYDWPAQSGAAYQSMVTSPVSGFGIHTNFTFQVLCPGSDTAAPEGKVLYGISDLDAWSYGKVKGGLNAYKYYAEGVNLNAGIHDTYVNAVNGLTIYNDNQTYCRDDVSGEATHEGWNTGLTFLGDSTGFSFSSSDSLHASSLFDLPKNNPYSITASATGMGTISPEGTTTYAENDFASYRIEASEGYIIESIAVDGHMIYRWDRDSAYTDTYHRLNLQKEGLSAGEHPARADFLFDRIVANHKIQVSFRIEEIEQRANITTTFAPQNGGTVDASLTGIKMGEERTIHYQPAVGWYIDQLRADGKTLDADEYPQSYTFTGISADHTLDVHFSNDPVLTLEQKVSNASKDDTADIQGMTVHYGTEMRYTATYKNTTNRSEDVVITAAIPSQTTLQTVDNKGSSGNGVIRWNIGKISPGTSGEVSFTVRVNDDATASSMESKFNADVTIAGSDVFHITSNTVSNHTPFCALTVADSEENNISGKTASLGQALKYRATLRNTSDVSKTFTIRSMIPEGSVYVASDGTYDKDKKEVTWSADLAPGGEKTVSLSVRAAKPGRYNAVFRVFCDSSLIDAVTAAYDIYVLHVDTFSSNSSKKLAGVGFLLKGSNGRYYHIDDSGQVTWVEESLASEQFSDENGKLTFSGIIPGKYTLMAKTVPTDYTPVDQALSVSVKEGSYEQTLQMPHKQIFQLPSAGGPGILLILIIAAALTVAGLLIGKKKKMPVSYE
ncbi:MAG: SpaA isopeptide-forming pilin-related protein [Bilifractor sp.]